MQLGPGGLGRAASMQGIVALLLTLAGAGLTTSVVKLGSEAATTPDVPRFRQLVQAAWSVWLYSSLATGAVILLFSAVSRWLAGIAIIPGADDVLVLASVCTCSATGILQGVISASRQIRLTTIVQVASSISGTVAGVLAITMLGEPGIALGVLMSYVGIMLPNIVAYRHVMKRHAVAPSLEVDLQLRRQLVGTGTPLAFSNLLGNGVQSLLPFLVVVYLGKESGGFLKAASLIALQASAVLATSLTHDYFPRVAAIREERSSLLPLVQSQFKLMLLCSTAIAGMITASASTLLRLCFSEQFVAATGLLDLLCIGITLRIGSWCLAYVVLARCSSSIYLLGEAIAGVALLISAILFMNLFGLNGVGYAFVLTYVVYFVVVARVVAKDTGSRLPWKMLFASLVAIIPILGIISLRTAIGLD